MTFEEAGDQTGIQALDHNILLKQKTGWGVIAPETGNCDVSIDTGNLGSSTATLSVAAGDAVLAGSKTAVSSQSVSIATGDALPRKDTVYLDETATVRVAEGASEATLPTGSALSAAERPAPSALKGVGACVLGVVIVPADATSVSASELVDKRPRADREFGDTTHRSLDTEEAITKKQPVVNVKAWGAKGDGSTNDTTAIQDALAHLKSVGGGCLFFPAGTYLVCEEPSPTATFDLRDKPNIEIAGVGYASHIKAAPVASDSDNGVIIFMGGENAHVHNIRVDGNRGNQGNVTDASDGANFVQLGANSVMHDVWSVNSTGDGVEPFGDDVVIHDCVFRNNEEQDIHFWGSNSIAEGNLCINCQEDGAIRVYTSDTKGGAVDNVRIADNLIVNPATYAIGIVQDSVITTNAVIEDNTIISPSAEGIKLNSADEPIVRGNIIDSPSGIGINCGFGQGVRTTAPKIEDNVIRDGGDSAMELTNIPDPKIIGNTIERCAYRAIKWTSNVASTLAKISDNEITDNNTADSGTNGVTVYANDVDLGKVLFKRNNIISTSTPHHDRGIEITNSTNGTISSVSIIENDVQNTDATTISWQSGVTVEEVRDNRPRVAVDVRNLATFRGNRAYHDGSGSNTEGEAQYISGASAWKSFVDGTTIS